MNSERTISKGGSNSSVIEDLPDDLTPYPLLKDYGGVQFNLFKHKKRTRAYKQATLYQHIAEDQYEAIPIKDVTFGKESYSKLKESLPITVFNSTSINISKGTVHKVKKYTNQPICTVPFHLCLHNNYEQ